MTHLTTEELQNIFIEPTKKTPQVDLNHLTGELILSGRSIPENAANLYETILKWVNQYIKSPKPNTNFRLNLEYFNTASSIWIAKILKVLSSIKGAANSLILHLYFNVEEFDDMDPDDLKDLLSPVIDMIGNATVNLSIKIYGTDDQGKILKESMVLI